MSPLPRRLRPAPLPEVEQLLAPIREGFLQLHKALLERERRAYEAAGGIVGGNTQFLQLLINDPFFAWLRPFGQFIVQIDEALETEAPLSRAGAHALLDQARVLLRASEAGTPAEQAYFAALQGDERIVLLHADLKRQLNNAVMVE
jgi:hypothetical protein